MLFAAKFNAVYLYEAYIFIHSMQSCICDVKAWATANMLKLNDSKTKPLRDLSISISYLLLSL